MSLDSGSVVVVGLYTSLFLIIFFTLVFFTMGEELPQIACIYVGGDNVLSEPPFF